MRYFIDPENFAYKPGVVFPERFEITRHIPASQFIGVVQTGGAGLSRHYRIRQPKGQVQTYLLYYRDGEVKEWMVDRSLTPAKWADRMEGLLDIKLTRVNMAESFEHRYGRFNLDALIAVADQPPIADENDPRQLLFFPGKRKAPGGFNHFHSDGEGIRPPDSVTIPCTYGALHVRRDRVEWVREAGNQIGIRVAGNELRVDPIGGLPALMGILGHEPVRLTPESE